MSTDVSVETRIGRPREVVSAYASDPGNDRAWIGALADARVDTDGSFGVGTRVARTARFLGRTMEYVNEVVAWEPGSRLERWDPSRRRFR